MAGLPVGKKPRSARLGGAEGNGWGSPVGCARAPRHSSISTSRALLWARERIPLGRMGRKGRFVGRTTCAGSSVLRGPESQSDSSVGYRRRHEEVREAGVLCQRPMGYSDAPGGPQLRERAWSSGLGSGLRCLALPPWAPLARAEPSGGAPARRGGAEALRSAQQAALGGGGCFCILGPFGRSRRIAGESRGRVPIGKMPRILRTCGAVGARRGCPPCAIEIAASADCFSIATSASCTVSAGPTSMSSSSGFLWKINASWRGKAEKCRAQRIALPHTHLGGHRLGPLAKAPPLPSTRAACRVKDERAPGPDETAPPPGGFPSAYSGVDL